MPLLLRELADDPVAAAASPARSPASTGWSRARSSSENQYIAKLKTSATARADQRRRSIRRTATRRAARTGRPWPRSGSRSSTRLMPGVIASSLLRGRARPRRRAFSQLRSTVPRRRFVRPPQPGSGAGPRNDMSPSSAIGVRDDEHDHERDHRHAPTTAVTSHDGRSALVVRPGRRRSSPRDRQVVEDADHRVHEHHRREPRPRSRRGRSRPGRSAAWPRTRRSAGRRPARP